MPKLARNLKTYRFDQLASLVNDRVDDPAASGVERYVGLEHLGAESLRITRWGEITDVESTKLRFQPGDIIFGKRRVYQRKLAVADFEGICSAHAMVLRPKSDVVVPAFLPFFMQSDLFMERALAISVGSLSPTINWTDLAAQEFSLPPVEEQQRLAAVLGAIESVADKYSILVATLRLAKQAYIDSATQVPEGATRVTALGKHCQMQNGRPFPGDQYLNEGVPLLRPGNLGPSGYLDWAPERTKYLPQHYLQEAADFVLAKGDVVINLTAQSLEDGFMGRVCLVRSADQSLLNQRIGRFHSFDSLRPEFLFRCLQSSRFQAHAKAMCEGSKIKHLFWPHLASFTLPVLSLQSQDGVCTCARQLDDQIDQTRVRRDKIGHLKRELLQSLASAVTRVNHEVQRI